MIRLIAAALLLTGCAQSDLVGPPTAHTNTTVYRYTTNACAPDASSEDLNQAIKSRNEWKRYAESLEKLPAAKPSQ